METLESEGVEHACDQGRRHPEPGSNCCSVRIRSVPNLKGAHCLLRPVTAGSGLRALGSPTRTLGSHSLSAVPLARAYLPRPLPNRELTALQLVGRTTHGIIPQCDTLSAVRPCGGSGLQASRSNRHET